AADAVRMKSRRVRGSFFSGISGLGGAGGGLISMVLAVLSPAGGGGGGGAGGAGGPPPASGRFVNVCWGARDPAGATPRASRRGGLHWRETTAVVRFGFAS